MKDIIENVRKLLLRVESAESLVEELRGNCKIKDMRIENLEEELHKLRKELMGRMKRGKK
jgi:GTP1/Obg family GTP-binding protein